MESFDTKIAAISHRMLFLNTLAFTVCFAVWIFNGVMVTFLVDHGVFNWGPVEIGWLFGIPILTGSVFRLPMGILTDKFGGKWVFGLLLLFCAIPLFFLSYANGFWSFALLSFGYGLAGSGFAVGVAFTSVWYPKRWQGRALGIFGAANSGAAITTLLMPTLLNRITNNGIDIEQWRVIPKIYAAALVIMAIVFLLFTKNKKPEVSTKTLKQVLKPIASVRVWRFGLYYFLVFGCFVAFSQWLVPYYVNVYATSLVVAGLFASLFSLPSGLIRIFGGWLSDKFGGRVVMKWVFRSSIALSALLIFPKMDIYTPGKGVVATKDGNVSSISATKIIIDSISYRVKSNETVATIHENENNILPVKNNWQIPIVKKDESVKKNQLLARGTTHLHFSAHIWIFTVLILLLGIVWGIGKAGVYRFIPDYFPNDIGAVGGMVGVIGGLGGFICPILFGYLLEWTGLWTSSLFLTLFLSILCYLLLNRVVNALLKKHTPIEISEQMDFKK